MPYYQVVYLMCRDAGNPAKTGGSTLNIIDVNAGITVTLDITVVDFYCFGYQHGKGCYMKNDGGQVVGRGAGDGARRNVPPGWMVLRFHPTRRSY